MDLDLLSSILSQLKVENKYKSISSLWNITYSKKDGYEYQILICFML